MDAPIFIASTIWTAATNIWKKNCAPGGPTSDGPRRNDAMTCPGCNIEMAKLDAEALTGQCPECQVDLVRVHGGARQHPLQYDTCESCGGIFLESEFRDATDIKLAFKEIVEFFHHFTGKKK